MPVVLGIDPGLAATGYGLVAERAGRLSCLAYGVIRTAAHHSTGQRLLQLFERIEELLVEHQPLEAGVETLYFSRNTSSALPVAQARGVVLMALERHGLATFEYTPQAIKQAVVGNGSADKLQVQHMVRVLLGLDAIPSPSHAADALAAAITQAHARAIPSMEQSRVQ